MFPAIRLKLQIVGVTCASCIIPIRRSLEKTRGIEWIGANVMLDLLLVDYEPTAITPDEIIAIIKKAGYTAVPRHNDLARSNGGAAITAADMGIPLVAPFPVHTETMGMGRIGGVLRAKVNPELTFEMVEDAIRRKNYGVLSTITGNGRPHSAGVLYGVSARTRPFALYIVTDRRSKKARDIMRNPSISFAIPIPRRPSFLPPNSVQFQGAAEVLPLSDEAAREAFNASRVLRRVLRMQLAQKEDVSTFLRVQPDPVVFTYGLGMSILRLMKHIEAAATRVEIPSSRL